MTDSKARVMIKMEDEWLNPYRNNLLKMFRGRFTPNKKGEVAFENEGTASGYVNYQAALEEIRTYLWKAMTHKKREHKKHINQWVSEEKATWWRNVRFDQKLRHKNNEQTRSK
eukprot:Platyproteum_vivax@DN4_c0_g1_i1.p2